MIEFRKVGKIYGRGTHQEVHALKDIDLEIERGEWVAIMGSSGSGKSTAMNILGLLDRPTSGEYLLDGQDVRTLTDEELASVRNRKIGFVFQKFHLLPKTTALENVELPLIYSHLDHTVQRSAAALDRVGLSHRRNHSTHELSGGQQQRVAIARALVTEPDVILADEPTGNLDSSSSIEIMEIFRQLHESGKTIILITHSEEIAKYAKRTVRIVDGQISSDVLVNPLPLQLPEVSR